MHNSEIKIFTTPTSLGEIKKIAEGTFVEYAKGVVDLNKKILGLGGEWHADIERVMLEQGSAQTDLWGINLYPDEPLPEMVEFDSMINIHPRQNNRSRGVEDPAVRQKILEIVTEFIKND